MTTIREIVELPGMPTWVRLTLGVIGVALLRLAQVAALPLIHGEWTVSHVLFVLVAAGIGLDALFAAARKRWPLVLFLDLIFAWAAGRSR